MNYCPCCSDVLLQHINGSKIYWFCRHCWQEMPESLSQRVGLLSENVVEELPKILHHQKKAITTVYSKKRTSTINGWIGRQDIPA
ncbi:MAG: hypothetical protein KME32_29340 [Mojavia pulchra JT2-VF2]|jgi:hypothetical protein|uniref:Uncharacterized protein n=1 Tax=Mojavia pulchra JT2-VF2 TaxID=287848 RepID=A0A951UJE8_9NOST|nr:hypothetical protein [Mojavia pulchra JT2-VF2]